MANDLFYSESGRMTLPQPATLPHPSIGPNNFFEYEVENGSEVLEWILVEEPPMENSHLWQSSGVGQAFHGGEPEAMTEFQMDAPVQIQARIPVPSDFQMDEQIKLYSGAPITMISNKFNRAEIDALLKEAEELDRVTMPLKKPNDHSVRSDKNGQNQSNGNLSPKEIKRMRKIAYCKRYREIKKAQRQKLEREIVLYEQQVDKSNLFKRQLQMCDAQINAEFMHLGAA